MTGMTRSILRHKLQEDGNGKRFHLVGLGGGRACQNGVRGLSAGGCETTVRTLWNPIGQLSKISSRPGNCANSEGSELCYEIA